MTVPLRYRQVTQINADRNHLREFAFICGYNSNHFSEISL